LLKLVRSLNVVVRGHGLSDEQLETAIKSYEAGASIAQVQVQIGMSYGAIRRALLRAGLTMRPRGFQPEVPPVKIS